jgi:hypothetical protein
MHTADIAMLTGIELIGLACIVNLWRRADRKPVAIKVIWSVALTVPLVGPLLYGAMYTPLPGNGKGDSTWENVSTSTTFDALNNNATDYQDHGRS